MSVQPRQNRAHRSPRLRSLIPLLCSIVYFPGLVCASDAERSGNPDVVACLQKQNQDERLSCVRSVVEQCRSLSSETSKLSCFESAFSAFDAQPVNEELTLPATAHDDLASQRTLPPLASISDERRFGLKDENLDYIQASIAKIEKDSQSKRYIWLDNDQVWKENTVSRLQLKEGDKIKITTGVLGNFFLESARSHRRVKVQRIK